MPSLGNPSQTVDAPVEQPHPTPAQMAALAKGQTVKWPQQGILWTVPANWKKLDVNNDSFLYGGDGAFLTVAISTMDAAFPTATSFATMHQAAKSNEKSGKYDEVKLLALDSVRGLATRESTREKPDDIRRLQWQAYRKYSGQTQLVTVILSSNGAAFPKHQDQLYAILFSAKFIH
jgi:hypothetical protein